MHRQRRRQVRSGKKNNRLLIKLQRLSLDAVSNPGRADRISTRTALSAHLDYLIVRMLRKTCLPRLVNVHIHIRPVWKPSNSTSVVSSVSVDSLEPPACSGITRTGHHDRIGALDSLVLPLESLMLPLAHSDCPLEWHSVCFRYVVSGVFVVLTIFIM